MLNCLYSSLSWWPRTDANDYVSQQILLKENEWLGWNKRTWSALPLQCWQQIDGFIQKWHNSSRDYFVYAPSQWEMLHCNIVCHWLGAYTKWSLLQYVSNGVTSFLLSHQNTLHKLGQYHGCWCPDPLHCQSICSHDIDSVFKSWSSTRIDSN